MGLMVLAGVAALVLTLLLLLAMAAVQLVLLLTVRNTLLVLSAVVFYWLVDSRRRQVARGFYSCTELPGREQPTATPTNENRAASKAVNKQDCVRQRLYASEPGEPALSEQARASDDSAQATDEETDAAATASTASDGGVKSSSDQVPVPAAVPSSPLSPSASSSPLSSTQLPGLRRHRWKFPSHSMPLKSKGDALLHHGHGGRRPTGGSASNSPRRPDLYGSPRSVTAEQKLVKTALESDGYFIGDFRVPAPPVLPKRSQSLGSRTTNTTATYVTRTAASRAV